MALLTWLKAKVQKPGSRGGIGYFDAKGEWRYGERPIAPVRPPDGRLLIELRRQKQLRFRGQRVEGAGDVAAAFRAMTDLDRERLWTVALGAEQQVMAIECVSIGGLDYALSDAREIVKAPAAMGATSLFVVHNHPSGDPTPSPQDRAALDAVRGAARHLGMDVRGLVVGQRGWSEIGRLTYGATEPTVPYHEPGGRFAPPEVAATRQSPFSIGSRIDSPDALLNALRGLYDPGQRTLVAVGMDTKGHIVSAQGLGMSLGAPERPVVTGFLRTLLLNGARSVALVAGKNGDAWSGEDGVSGLVEAWVLELGAAAQSLRIPTVDCLVVGAKGYASLRDRDVMRELSAQRDPTTWNKAGESVADSGATQSFGKAFSFKPAEPAGKIPLGKTRTGKAVFASGAEAGDFGDEDHQDAAHLHAAANVHHEHLAGAHRKAAEGDDEDWRRSESHHQAAERHDALATHHFQRVRQHLIAGGHGGEVRLEVQGKAARPRLAPMRRHPAAARAAAKEALGKRTHHDHPGGVTDADKAAYARFPASAAAKPADAERPAGDAKGKGAAGG